MSSKELKNLSVKDQIPSSLDFVSGPGNFDSKNQTLNFTIDKLASTETKTFDVKFKIKPANNLPSSPVTCPTNQAEVRVEQLVSQDSASFCIEREVLGVTRDLPKTGPKESAYILIGSILLFTLSVTLLLKNKVTT